ncbi:MAG: hypothetical protein KGI70_02730 [Patescibacteria group bacterium]|nr:hypothetical protein [Patescibacteria group bacterium]
MKTKLLIGALSAALLVGAPAAALAHDGGDDNGLHIGENADVNAGLHLGQILGVRAHGDGDINGDDDNDGDHGTVEASSIERANADFRSHVAVGTVTAINGSTITIDPVGKDATETITTNSSTVFKAEGSATTSPAIAVGDRVFAVGTTTATSTTQGDTFAASLIAMIGNGLKHLGHFFRID